MPLRPLLAVLLAVAILGGMQLFFALRTTPQRDGAYIENAAPGEFAIEITLSFEAGPDPFDLDAEAPPSLEVTFANSTLLRRTDAIAAGEPIVVPILMEGNEANAAEASAKTPRIVAGKNEFYLRAHPQNASGGAAHAARVRVLRDGAPLADATIWSEPGQPVEGPVVVEVPE